MRTQMSKTRSRERVRKAFVTLSVSEYYILLEVLTQAYCLAKITLS